MQGETMLRLENVKDEAALESVRDALDRVGTDYEFISAEPDEDTYPQTAYFYVSEGDADHVDSAVQKLIGRGVNLGSARHHPLQALLFAALMAWGFRAQVKAGPDRRDR